MENQQKQKDSLKFMEFSLMHEHFAIPLLKVREVISIPEVTPIPGAPAYFEGIMNLRGQIISVIDLRKKLSMPSSEKAEESAVIILDYDYFLIGIVVDSVNKVLSVTEEELTEPSIKEKGKKFEFIKAVINSGSYLILCIDIGEVLEIADLEILKNNSGEQKAA